jgi:peptidoglycan/LPS O-acetylase OafA/YrhL
VQNSEYRSPPTAACHHPRVRRDQPFGISKYQPALDGVRSVAVLTVVGFHARHEWFPGGYIGVDIFFVMSGFLITTILLAERQMKGHVSVRSFYIRRALRLLPALLLVCIAVALAFLLVPGVTYRSATFLGVLTAVTYTSSPVLAAGVSDLGWMIHTWSLSVEEYFYLVWPFLLIVGTARGARYWRALVVGLTVTAIAYRFSAPAVFGWSLRRVAYAADTRAEQLLIGCLLAVVLTVARRKIPMWLVLLAGVSLAAMVLLPGDITSELYLYGGSTLVALMAAALIAGVVQNPAGPLARLLSLKPLVWVGRRSYGIYLWNLPIVAVIAATSLSDHLQLVVKIGLTFLIPALSYRWVELPFLHMKARLRERESKAKAKQSPESPFDIKLVPAGYDARVGQDRSG